MHVSDYGYSADLKKCQSTLYNYNESTCTSTNWMYESTKGQWTLIPNSTYDDAVFAIVDSGSAQANLVYSNNRSVRPVLYLNSDVGIVEEKETEEGLKYFVVE